MENMEEHNETALTNQLGTVIYMNTKESNGIGTAGFVISLICMLFSWVPVLSWGLWVIGLILSFVGIFKKPRGLAIAGLIISCFDLIVILVVVSAIAALLAALI